MRLMMMFVWKQRVMFTRFKSMTKYFLPHHRKNLEYFNAFWD